MAKQKPGHLTNERFNQTSGAWNTLQCVEVKLAGSLAGKSKSGQCNVCALYLQQNQAVLLCTITTTNKSKCYIHF